MPQTDLGIATAVAERLRMAVARETFTAAGGSAQLPVTISIGVTIASGPHDDPRQILQRADVALYAAKARGRNCVIVGQSPSPPRAAA
jgi:diguanylate cyclase (GGDEF)-like protein